MHPEIVRFGPGSCPICGMALEPMDVFAAVEADPEYDSMRLRFWVSAALSLPVLLLSMLGESLGLHLTSTVRNAIEFFLATPVVLWGGWPFFERFWSSLVNRSPNMFTLIGLGTGAAYFDSVVATFFPQIFPASFRSTDGAAPVYFEAAAVITTLVLLGQVLELRARSRTGRPRKIRARRTRRARAEPVPGIDYIYIRGLGGRLATVSTPARRPRHAAPIQQEQLRCDVRRAAEDSAAVRGHESPHELSVQLYGQSIEQHLRSIRHGTYRRDAQRRLFEQLRPAVRSVVRASVARQSDSSGLH